MLKSLKDKSGSYILNNPLVIVILVICMIILGWIIAKGGLFIAIGILFIPPILIYLNRLFVKPQIGLYTLIIFGFIAIGLNRYIVGLPLGMSIDIFLTLTLIAVFFKFFYNKANLSIINTDLSWLMLIWFIYSIMQLANPEVLSQKAWFYAMRSISLYPLLAIPLTYLLFNKVKYLYILIYLWGIFSILGTLKGLQQLYMGPDYAEQRWLDQIGGLTHVLFGQLRIFSFYSDAGQFGAAQGAAGIAGLIIALNIKGLYKKLFFLIMGMLGLWGMMISGTRGAIIVPLLGGMVYLIHRKNIKILILGGFLMLGIYGFFRFTYIGHTNAQIRRMRTAFRPSDDASLQVRLDNRRILQVYLKSRPFGGGIGSAGGWGTRFSPHGFLANVATDSWYVQIWAEQGIVGLTLHLFILAYIFTKSSYLIMFKIHDPELRGILSALCAAFAGIMGANYSNGVLGQIPTSIITYMSWVFIFISPYFDYELRKLKAKP
ncbi:MAG: O-antigen ligase family protein [Bacteroidales bacterium]|nr:O-antigen ligase family protein [Bacteroidales bacterium]